MLAAILPMLRPVVDECGQSCRAGSLWRLGSRQVNPHRQFLAQFYSELIEGVHAPDSSLDKHAVLVQRQNTPQGARRRLWIQKQRTGAIPLVDPVNGDALDLPRAHSRLAHVRLNLGQWISIGKGLRLREAVLQRQVLAFGAAPRTAKGCYEIERLGQGPLMQHLKEGVLGIGAGFAPDDGRRGKTYM